MTALVLLTVLVWLFGNAMLFGIVMIVWAFLGVACLWWAVDVMFEPEFKPKECAGEPDPFALDKISDWSPLYDPPRSPGHEGPPCCAQCRVLGDPTGPVRLP